MTRALMLLPLLSLSLLGACGGKGDYTAILDLEGDPAAGESIYSGDCAGCHGAAGEGVSGPALAGKLPSDTTILDYVFNGEEAMPAFSFSDQEAADLLAYLGDTF